MSMCALFSVYRGKSYTNKGYHRLHQRYYCLTHQVGLTGRVVLLRAHANQAVIVEENAKWVAGSDEDVDAQVELVPLHQEGLVQVLLNDKVLLSRQLLAVADKRDPG